jgi:tRNA-2-methylthio-N6-dimethylallyladenosine synthase
VGGCLAEQEGRNLTARAPFVSLVAGPRRLAEIPELLEELDPGAPAVILAGDSPLAPAGFPAPPDFPAPGIRPEASAKVPPEVLSAYVTIMEGCDNFCAYCVVPYLRGRERSRPPAEILAEAESLLARGCREITLLGQNVNSYAPGGRGLGENGRDFIELLRRLDAYPELRRLRFTTSHPKDFPPALIDLFGELPSLAPHLHLPLQSGSDRILQAMGRRYDRKTYLALTESLRRANPDLALSADIIAGFPGETEEDLEDTLAVLQEVRFDFIYSFKYSDRPQTKALALPGKLSEEVKGDRLRRIQELQKKITLQIHRSLEGRTLEVLVTGSGREPGQLSGRSGGMKTVNFQGPPELYGCLVPVTIVSGRPASLVGCPAD